MIEYDDFLPRPNPNRDALEVVQLCMDTLLQGMAGAGLEVCFDFSSDQCRVCAQQQHSSQRLEENNKDLHASK